LEILARLLPVIFVRPVYESLGISRKTLYEKMPKYGLDKRMLITES